MFRNANVLSSTLRIMYTKGKNEAKDDKNGELERIVLILWKLVEGRLIHTTDESRVKFRTNISQSILESLKVMATENRTYVNYLLESGLKKVLSEGVISFNKETRPKDRIQYKTTYDKELLASVKEFATQHNVFINDVIEYSVQFIDEDDVKNESHRFRIE